ncbi:hypothetical protein KSS87_012142 [Heliosperma pusillum]|nr:hypothetical protein KSS87_012142 [Heliosperma pusillum]
MNPSTSNRRSLHQPFFPQDSTPPTPPTPTPPNPKLPFSTSTPDKPPFFPSYPSPPPSLPSPSLNPSPFASFPANISSLILPHSPSTHPLNSKLIAVTVALSLSAAVIAAVAIFFFLRGRRRRRHTSDDKSAAATPPPANFRRSSPARNFPPPPTAPKVRNPGPNSSEFLYLGTLVNSAAIDGAQAQGHARTNRSVTRKLDSPELHPLPPFSSRQQQAQQWRTSQEHMHRGDEDQEEFYSPRGSVSGRESGSESRRVFANVVAQGHNNGGNNGGNCDDTTSSSSSSSTSNSPARSASISISPPISASPKNRSAISNPKSPEFIELNVQSHAPPASPPLPEMTFSPPYSPSSSGTEKDMAAIKEEEDEAEESPLLSNGSSSNRMNSPPESPRLSPMTRKIGKSSPEERELSALSRNSPSAMSPASPSLSDGSSSSQRLSFSSLKLPAFLGGGKRKGSQDSTSMMNSPVSPHSPPSPMSSSGSSSRHSRSYPASPLSNASERKMSESAAPAPPPPPPPPPALRRSHSPPPPPRPPMSEPVAITTPVKPVVVEKRQAESPVECLASAESEETTPKPKLKPLHWDKVRASSDREMVWDQFRSSSFKLNEEMIETLFIVNTPNPSQKEVPRNPVQLLPKQENRVLDPKKAQNIAILLRALNVTMEEVCEALMEGNAETLGTELLESLLKMAPTKEEERKLMEYKDDSPVKLGHAEKFLKAVIDIPFAFKRVEAMLYIANFESEVEYLKKSFETLEVACDELRSSRLFLKLLEAVLKTGNRMNVGTNRGDAHAFKLDTLLKLVDIKGADGKTTLLHFVVQEIIRTEGQRLLVANNQPLNDEPKCRKLGLQVVSSLSSELTNVKKSAAMDSDVLSNDVAKLTLGLGNIGEVVKLIDQVDFRESKRRFSESMNKFIKLAEEDIFRVQALERVALSLVKEITEYFHGNSAKEEAHPFRIFMVVRDFLTVLDRVCKEVGMINERTTVSSAHRFPVPVNPMLPVPVNPFHPQVLPGLSGLRKSSFSDDGSP